MNKLFNSLAFPMNREASKKQIPLSKRRLALTILAAAACMLVTPPAWSATVSIDSARTFLRTSSDPDARDSVPINLVAIGIQPGDVVKIERLGYYRNGDPRFGFTDRVTGMVSVFSASSTLLPSNVQARVPDALDAGTDWMSPPAYFGSLPTDIPEDFLVSDVFILAPSSSVTVRVPAGATHLFVAAVDIFYGDNDDPNGDFAVRISLLDSDNDGVPDDRDDCVPSDMRANVDVESGPTSIANLVDARGCTIQDFVNASAAEARNHGDYVSSIVALANDLFDAGVITQSQRREMITGAAQSTIGNS